MVSESEDGGFLPVFKNNQSAINDSTGSVLRKIKEIYAKDASYREQQLDSLDSIKIAVEKKIPNESYTGKAGWVALTLYEERKSKHTKIFILLVVMGTVLVYSREFI